MPFRRTIKTKTLLCGAFFYCVVLNAGYKKGETSPICIFTKQAGKAGKGMSAFV